MTTLHLLVWTGFGLGVMARLSVYVNVGRRMRKSSAPPLDKA